MASLLKREGEVEQQGPLQNPGESFPMERAEEAFRAMWKGRTRGKTVFTRARDGQE